MNSLNFRGIRDELPKLRTTKCGLIKLETSLYDVVKMHFSILNRSGVDHECDRRRWHQRGLTIRTKNLEA